MCNIACLQDIKPLLQVHASAEGLFSCASEDGASQLGFRIVPLPKCTELNRCFDRETVAMLRAIDSDQKNMLSWEADDAVLDVRVRGFDP